MVNCKDKHNEYVFNHGECLICGNTKPLINMINMTVDSVDVIDRYFKILRKQSNIGNGVIKLTKQQQDNLIRYFFTREE